MTLKNLGLFFVFSTALAVAPLTAFSAPSCYSSAELAAEQLLRLHSELMVVSILCKQASTGQNLISAYTGFTRNNIGVLRDAEQTMIRYYNATSGDGIASLDRLRTRLGNEYGQQIADVSAPLFCRLKRDMVLDLYRETPGQLANEVRHMEQTEKSYVSLCALPAAAAPGSVHVAANTSSAVSPGAVSIVPPAAGAANVNRSAAINIESGARF